MAKKYVAEIILAIEYLHINGIMYRDLKPENVLIDMEGHVKLVDFGLVKMNMNRKKRSNSFCGTSTYLSPEMIN